MVQFYLIFLLFVNFVTDCLSKQIFAQNLSQPPLNFYMLTFFNNLEVPLKRLMEK